MLRLITPYFQGNDKTYARIMGFILAALSLSKVYCGYLFTQWNRRFFDAIETKNMDGFLQESLYFSILALVFVALYSLSRYLCQRYALRWRLWMTNYALTRWLKCKNRNLEGADQRIQEDLMRFTDIFERISLEMINNIVLIIWFTPLLFKCTQNVSFGGIHIPGLLFYIVIGYTLFGLWISKKIATPLIGLEYDSQKYEAAFRHQLVYAMDGKSCQPKDFERLIQPIATNHIDIYKKQKSFNFWQKSYDQFSFLIPYLIVGPSYFTGLVTLGALMQTRSIFSRIRNAMAYILDNYAEVMELVAIANRLSEFFNYINIQTNENYPKKPSKDAILTLVSSTQA